MGMGDSTKAALMTRRIAEITRLGTEMGGRPETFGGLSGIGGLIVTCTSTHSRNHNCGYLLGQGKTLAEAKKEIKQVVEQVNAILFEDKPTVLAMQELLERDKVSEYKDMTW